jgi:hypothetical protein
MVDVQNVALGRHIDIIMSLVGESAEFIDIVCPVMVDAGLMNIDSGNMMLRGLQDVLWHVTNRDP